MSRILLILTLALFIVGCGDNDDKLIGESNSATDNKYDVIEKIDTTPYDNMSSEEKNLALIEASKNGDLDAVKALIDTSVSVDVNTESDDGDMSGTTPLMMASRNGHIEIVELLIKNGANVHAERYYGGFTALNDASRNGHTEIVELLIKNGAQDTFLIDAATAGDFEKVKSLIEEGDDIDASNNNTTPLIEASDAGHLTIVKKHITMKILLMEN